MCYKFKQKQIRKQQRRRERSTAAIACYRAKHLIKQQWAILNQLCKKHTKLQARLVASNGERAQLDSDGDVFQECIEPEFHDSILVPASKGIVNYPGQNTLHGFTTSFTDVDVEWLNT